MGGDGAIDRLVFPELCGPGLTVQSAIDVAKRLLEDDQYYTATLAHARELAVEKVSFTKVREQLVGPVFALDLSLIAQRQNPIDGLLDQIVRATCAGSDANAQRNLCGKPIRGR